MYRHKLEQVSLNLLQKSSKVKAKNKVGYGRVRNACRAWMFLELEHCSGEQIIHEIVMS